MLPGSENVDPGAYALIGAGAMLASVTRITVTLTVILFETTGRWDLLPVLMAVVQCLS